MFRSGHARRGSQPWVPTGLTRADMASMRIPSGELQLEVEFFAPPEGDKRSHNALLLCHGFPSTDGDVVTRAGMDRLAERISADLNWNVLAMRFRGCRPSEGDFTLAGWLADVTAGVDALADMENTTDILAAGFGTGGAVCMCAAASDARIRGVAAMATPADFDDWAANPAELVEHALTVGVIHDDNAMNRLSEMSAEIAGVSPLVAAPELSDRPMLVMHGARDDMVPVVDARVLANAHGSAELMIIDGADHGLRVDPRAIAALYGWLFRQTSEP